MKANSTGAARCSPIVLRRHRLDGAQIEPLLRRNRIGEPDAGKRVAIEAGVDGDDTRLRIGQRQGKAAPAGGVSDGEDAARAEALE